MNFLDIFCFNEATITTAHVEGNASSIVLPWDKYPWYVIVCAILVGFICIIVLLRYIIRTKKRKGEIFMVNKFGLAGVEAERKGLPVEQVTFVEQPTFDLSYPILFHDICVKVSDAKGYTLPGRNVVLTCKDFSQKEILIGNLTASTDQTGTAKFAGLTSNSVGNFKIIASCEGKQCASEIIILPDMKCDPEELVFLIQPQSASGHPAIINPIKIRAINNDGEGLPKRMVKIKCFDSRCNEDILQGNCEMKTDEHGEVVFSDLKIYKTGNFRLCVVCGGITCESASFEVSPPSFDNNFESKVFGSQEYWDALTLNLFEEKGNDTVRIDGEEI